jgi:hypothetical protein
MQLAAPNTWQSLAPAALDHLLIIPRPGGFLDPALGFGWLPGDALGE